MPKAGKIDANGLEISFLEEGAGPLFLCVHGFPDCPRSFRHQFAAFADAGYRVVAPYLRGYTPESVRDGQSYQAAALGTDLLALIDALGYERAVVYGHDWGTYAVYSAALAEPSKIERLIAAALPYGPGLPAALVTSPVQQRRSWYMFYFQTRLAEIAVPLDDFTFIEALWRDWSPGANIEPSELRAVKDTLAAPGVLSAALAYYRTVMNPSLRDPALAALENRFGVDPIEVPSLYIHGRDDRCIGVETTRGMEALFPAGLRRVEMKAVGHFVHWEDPSVFNKTVLDFLGA